MRITILTIFPEAFDSFLKMPLISRAIEKGTAQIEITDIREYAGGSFRHIDDSPYGGGAGMIMRFPPVLAALNSVRSGEDTVILTCAAGRPYSQQDARRLADHKHLILIAGHYEGMDARIYDHADELISVGDYVLSGGELPVMTIIDSIIRLQPGIIRTVSTEEESFENGLLEYPQYTRPASYASQKVPEVLLSGNHEEIRRWRLEQSLLWTAEYRPNLLENRQLTEEEQTILEKAKEKSHEGSE